MVTGLERILKTGIGTVGLLGALTFPTLSKGQEAYSLTNSNVIHQAATNGVNNVIRNLDVNSHYLTWSESSNIFVLDLTSNQKSVVAEVLYGPDAVKVAGKSIVWTADGIDEQRNIYSWDLINGIKEVAIATNLSDIVTSDNLIVYNSDNGEDMLYLLPLGGISTNLPLDARRIKSNFVVENDKLKYWKHDITNGVSQLTEYDFSTSTENELFTVADQEASIRQLASSGTNTAWVLINRDFEEDISTLYLNNGLKTTLIKTFAGQTEDLDIEGNRIAWVMNNGEVNYWTPRTGTSCLLSGGTNYYSNLDIKLKSGKIYFNDREQLIVADIVRNSPINPTMIIVKEDDNDESREIFVHPVVPGTKLKLYESEDLINWNLIDEWNRNPSSGTTARYVIKCDGEKKFFRTSVENLLE